MSYTPSRQRTTVFIHFDILHGGVNSFIVTYFPITQGAQREHYHINQTALVKLQAFLADIIKIYPQVKVTEMHNW